jgi:hypothetical protein
VTARAVRGALPWQNPGNRTWRRAQPLLVSLAPQQIVAPQLRAASVPEIVVRALFNGEQLAVQAEWSDAERDSTESTARFRDSMAVMLPLDPAAGTVPPILMGAPGAPVRILHWKASWQVDRDRGFQDVDASYPRWFNDVYPGHPELAARGLTGEVADAYDVARAAGNPLSLRDRTTSVEDLVAEGFGTLTTRPQQAARGHGVHGRRGWRVAIELPAGDADGPRLQPGGRLPIAFAVWDGSARQVGGRKHFTDWITIDLPAAP